MKGINIVKGEERNGLELTEFEKPVPQAGELLVEVHAAGVNRTDIMTRDNPRGYGANRRLGVEVAGVVAETKGDAHGFQVGDRVMGLVDQGGYAEFAVMPADRAMRIPESFSFEQAAAVPEVFLTAYQTLFWHGKLAPNETVLIHAGGSGVGTAAIQLAKQLVQAKVIVTAGSAEKLAFCRELEADVLINYKEQSFEEEVLKATNGEGTDVILDFVGASYWDKNMQSIKKGGRWVLIGTLGGATVERVNLLGLMSKYIQLTGTLLTPRSAEYKAQLTQEFAQRVLPLMEESTVKPIVDTVFPLEQAAEAQEYMEQSKNIGKIILKVKE